MGLFDGLFNAFDSSNGESNAKKANAAANKGNDQAQGTQKKYLRKGVGAVDTATGQAAPLYQSLLDSNKAGATAYGNAVGINGQAGYDQAVQQFHTNPGYQFAFDQGMQALDRNHAAAGNYNSGNWGADAIKYGVGQADQAWNTHLSQLSPYLQGQYQATSGLGNLYSHAGDVKAGLYSGAGNNLAGLQVAQGQNNADMWANINNAQTAASQNWMGLLTGGLGLAGKIYGGTGTGTA